MQKSRDRYEEREIQLAVDSGSDAQGDTGSGIRAVSGATFSSNGIIGAVTDALANALAAMTELTTTLAGGTTTETSSADVAKEDTKQPPRRWQWTRTG